VCREVDRVLLALRAPEAPGGAGAGAEAELGGVLRALAQAGAFLTPAEGRWLLRAEGPAGPRDANGSKGTRLLGLARFLIESFRPASAEDAAMREEAQASPPPRAPPKRAGTAVERSLS
jgi:hypothetical protein